MLISTIIARDTALMCQPKLNNKHFLTRGPVGTRGLSRDVSSVSAACRKRRLNGAVSRNNRIKSNANNVAERLCRNPKCSNVAKCSNYYILPCMALTSIGKM